MSLRIHVATYSSSSSLNPPALHTCLISLLRLSIGYGPWHNRQFFNVNHCVFTSPLKRTCHYLDCTHLGAWASIINCEFSWPSLVSPILEFLFFPNKKEVHALLAGMPIFFLSLEESSFYGYSVGGNLIRECNRRRGRAKVKLCAAYLVG